MEKDSNPIVQNEDIMGLNSLPENSLTEQTNFLIKQNSQIEKDLNAPFYFVKTFPWLFPYGSGSMMGNHTRKIKILRKDWFAHVINLGYMPRNRNVLNEKRNIHTVKKKKKY